MSSLPENMTPPASPFLNNSAETEKAGKKRPWFWWLILFVILGLLAWRLTHLGGAVSSKGGPGHGGVTAPIPVTVMPATTEDFPVYLDGLGTVQAYNSVLVNARVTGLIQEIKFQEGQAVNQGDVLAVIDPRTFQAQYDQAVAKTAQDVAQVESAKILLARDQELLVKNVLDHQTYDTQRYLVAQLQGTVQADQANQEMQKSQLDWTQVTAPISGRTGVRQVDVGNQVTVGANSANGSSSIVVINQIKPIFVAFTLPQQDLTQIREPFLAHKSLEVIALDRNNQTALSRGTLSVIDNQIDTTTATIKLKAVFSNDDYKLWPGQFVNVRLLVGHRPDSVVVPTEAVQLGPEGSYVYVVGVENKATMQAVTTGPSEAGLTLIESGLKAGEKVVTDGQYRLQPDSLVITAPKKNKGKMKNEEVGGRGAVSSQ
jgi:multidrug efflux system membrane fusion protein